MSTPEATVETSPRAQTVDWLIVLSVAAVSSTGVGLERPWDGGSWGLAATGLASALPLAVRRRHPLICAPLVGAVLVLQVLWGGSLHLGSLMAALITVFSVGRHVRSSVWSAVGALTLVALVLAATVRGLRESPTDVVFPLFYFSVGWALGRGARVLEERTSSLRRLNEVLARDREISTQLAVATERLRLARELHDVVAHTVMVMVWQAEAAEELLDQNASTHRMREAMRNVQEAGRRGLTDLRSLVGVLREDADGRLAAPSLEDLGALTALMSRSGLTVDLQLDVPAHTWAHLPAELGAALYRLVQESLTNVVRHSHADRATVSVGIEAGALRVRVEDAGPFRTDPRPGSGHGISGMRERATTLGGTVTAGRRADGYVVEALLPLSGSVA